MNVVILAFTLLLQASPAPQWQEVFSGKSEFGHCTRVVSIKRGIVFLDSPPITRDNGGDVYVLLDTAKRPAKVLSVDEQGAHRIIRMGKQLVIPGTDATENWSLGNYYVSDDDAVTWHKVRNIPNGIHVFDMCKWRGKWYVGCAVNGGGRVYESTDEGKTWFVSYSYKPKNAFGEVLMVLPLSDGLYAHVVKLWGTKEETFDFARYDGKKWETLKLLGNKGACWNYRLDGGSAWLAKGRSSWLLEKGKLVAIPSLDGKAMTDFEFPDAKHVLAVGRDPSRKASSIYLADRTSTTDIGEFKWILDLSKGYSGNSLAIHNKRLYCACAVDKGGKVISIPLKSVMGK
jgi:hypothetical protein